MSAHPRYPTEADRLRDDLEATRRASQTAAEAYDVQVRAREQAEALQAQAEAHVARLRETLSETLGSLHVLSGNVTTLRNWVIQNAPHALDEANRILDARREAHERIVAALNATPADSADAYRLRAKEWLSSHDTGISSETIWSVMTGYPVSRTGVPIDPEDFGRCYRLLQRFPEWRSRLNEVAHAYPAWKPLVGAWSEMEKLYEEELPNRTAPKLYDLMSRLLNRK